jgi:hypothetical protein
MKFFHVHANAHHRRSFIPSLVHDGHVLVNEDSKVEAAFSFFSKILSTPAQRQHSIHLGILDLPRLNLSELGDHFTKAEVMQAIRLLLPDKAPVPYNFMARFLQSCWDIIRPDLMVAFDAFWRPDTRNFQDANEALLTLHPKSQESESLKDYRPISMIHILRKLFSKVLTNRLTPRLSALIYPAQSAFIKGRHIQDSFRVVQSTARLLHARRCPSLLLKVDIAKAFDSVAWPFLFEVLRHARFPNGWVNCVSVLLSTASTQVMLNGSQGSKICHTRGLRQGDPL